MAGGGTSGVRDLAPEFPFEVARRGYAVGSAVLQAVLPPIEGPSSPLPYSDMAVVWIDSNHEIGTPASQYPGFHAMAVPVLTGHGDRDILNLLPATLTPDRVALVGLHEWTEDDSPNIAEWGESFSPEDLRQSSQPFLDWLASTGCSRVALRFDVDTIDGAEIVLGLGHPAGGLTVPKRDASSPTSQERSTSSP